MAMRAVTHAVYKVGGGIARYLGAHYSGRQSGDAMLGLALEQFVSDAVGKRVL